MSAPWVVQLLVLMVYTGFREDDVIDMDIVHEDDSVLIVTTKGFGKRTPMSEYRIQTRGVKGLRP